MMSTCAKSQAERIDFRVYGLSFICSPKEKTLLDYRLRLMNFDLKDHMDIVRHVQEDIYIFFKV
jgi:hypothetical protein